MIAILPVQMLSFFLTFLIKAILVHIHHSLRVIYTVVIFEGPCSPWNCGRALQEILSVAAAILLYILFLQPKLSLVMSLLGCFLLSTSTHMDIPLHPLPPLYQSPDNSRIMLVPEILFQPFFSLKYIPSLSLSDN